LKIVALAGGVGGAKLVAGLAKILPEDHLIVVVNTGDDFEYLNLKISPDLDTVCYTLAGLANPVTGWGQKNETWVTYDAIAGLGGPDWFKLGDRDLATHLVRTKLLSEGKRLSEITRLFCQRWGIMHAVYPMSDDPVRTIVHTQKDEALGFQEYFVHQACQPKVKSFEFKGIETAKPLPAVLQGIRDADIVIFAPSNPWVSIDPILSVPSYRDAISQKPVLAISPIIGGKAVKGPAAKMYQELGFQATATSVAKHYQGLVTGFVLDNMDLSELEKIERWRIISFRTNILMKNEQDRIRLAEEVITFGDMILNRSL